MSYEVVADDLMAHASHLDGVMDRLGTAISAAQTVSMSDEAYGLLCAFLPPIINPMEEQGISALQAASEGLGITAENVRSTAGLYQETDTNNAEPLRKTLVSSADSA